MMEFKVGDIVRLKYDSTRGEAEVSAVLPKKDIWGRKYVVEYLLPESVYFLTTGEDFELVPQEFEVGKSYTIPGKNGNVYSVVAKCDDKIIGWLTYPSGTVTFWTAYTKDYGFLGYKEAE